MFIRFRVLVVLALLVGLSACSGGHRAEMAAAAQRQMVGLSREDVLTCMGIPAKKATVEATEVWAYASTSGHSEHNSTSTKVGDYRIGGGSSDKSFCIVNVVMKNGTVTRVNYNGASGSPFTPNEQCGFAVANCVTPEQF